KDGASAPAIRVTPPAPVIDDKERLAELASRRARVGEKIGPNSILVLFSAEPRVYTNDVDYEYRQENNLFYLTNLKQKSATLVLIPGNPRLREILFLPRRDSTAETWTGHMYSAEEARAASGIREIWDTKEFEPFMRALRNRQAYRPKPEAIFMSASAHAPAQPATASGVANAGATDSTTGFENLFGAMSRDEASLYLLLPREDESREYKQEQAYAAQWSRSASGFNVRNAAPIFAQMRLIKSPLELKLLQHAIDITTEAHERAMAVAGRSEWEYEVESEIIYTYKRRNADHWGYPDIVGCGPNATTLHYQESQGRVKSGDLLLMDVGAEYGHYTADVTRTFPVSGKFSPEQRDIYQVVYDAQEAVAAATRPGATFPSDVHNAGVEKIKDGLLKLGLITDRNGTITLPGSTEPQPQYRIWFMHGTSHWLGMNVHDVGGRNVKLQPGMVFTNEPGIYIRPDALDNLPKTPENQKFIEAVRPAFDRYKNIGVRIEDDLLVTEKGVEWLTGALPRSITDIEAFMARAPKEVRIGALEKRWLESGIIPLSALALS
nr:aminopeptidase P family protein [Acidobacteriota bacterium]